MRIHAKFAAQHLPAERGLRQHAVDGLFDDALRMRGHHGGIGHMFFMAHETGVLEISLLLGLPTRDFDLVRVDHDDKVAGVHVRSVHGLVFAANDACNFSREAAKNHAFCIDNEPLAVDVLRSGAIGLHTSFVACVMRALGFRTYSGLNNPGRKQPCLALAEKRLTLADCQGRGELGQIRNVANDLDGCQSADSGCSSRSRSRFCRQHGD